MEQLNEVFVDKILQKRCCWVSYTFLQKSSSFKILQHFKRKLCC
eukprot:UN12716